MGRYAVFGATGGTGRDVVAILVASGDHVVAIGRSTKQLHALAERGVETVALDLTHAAVEELATILTECDGVIFLAGSTDPRKVMEVDPSVRARRGRHAHPCGHRCCDLVQNRKKEQKEKL